MYFSKNGSVHCYLLSNDTHLTAQMYRLIYNRNQLSNNKCVGIPKCRRVFQCRSYTDSCSRLDRDQEEGIVQSISSWRIPENKEASYNP